MCIAVRRCDHYGSFDMSIILLGLVGLAVFVGAIVVAGFKSADIEAEKMAKNRSNREEISLSAENERVLKLSGQLLLDERLLAGRIKNEDVRNALLPALDKADEIIKALKKDPGNIQNTKQFLNYYVPTLDAILKKYLKLEASNVDITQDTEKILSYLADINKAMDRQYKNLFNDDKLDLSVEMEAMTMAFKRDGLISESEYIKEDAPQEIQLTL